ncbi:MAG: SRPBCC family protein [Nocardioidaceae bacterium]
MVDSVSKKYTKAPPLRVWDVLCDGYRYADWVMGTKEIRAVDDGFPTVGTAIHFTAGVGPITYRNKTTVRSSVEMQCLELEAHGWPAGSVRIVLTIEPSGEGCNLTFDEHPLRGPARWLHNPVTNVVFNARTSMILGNLIKLAESGEPVQPAGSEPTDSDTGPSSDQEISGAPVSRDEDE